MTIKWFSALLFFVCVCGFLISCQQKTEPDQPELEYPELLEYKKDMVRVKFSENTAAAIEAGAVLSDRVRYMERTFPYAGEFEERTRKEGLHLWYDVYLNDDASLTKAGDFLSTLDGVQVVEYRPLVRRSSNPVIEVPASPEAGEELIFDDPMLAQQWHYFNDGSSPKSLAGADINVFPVWEKYPDGSGDVVVSVVDGGVDAEHEDLAANMWSANAEDGTLIHGYNFIDGSYNIVPTTHGTHVAGTVAAVNNNGKGVCGVAGGDYRSEKAGAKIMSCQILDEGSDTQGDGARAIKWSADHGAIISQNSWGYTDPKLTDTPLSDKEAIDYFIKYAGLDKDGKQVGPMAGGLVVFAAGNSGRKIGYPASYEPCLAVSAISSDYEAALYTNYGDWVDVIAPGGDASKNVYILSTIPGNRYGKSQGTSMACPHVSGIAALLVARFGGPGFTSARLRELIESSLRDISSYSPYMYFGKGLVDTHAAFLAGEASPMRRE